MVTLDTGCFSAMLNACGSRVFYVLFTGSLNFFFTLYTQIMCLTVKCAYCDVMANFIGHTFTKEVSIVSSQELLILLLPQFAYVLYFSTIFYANLQSTSIAIHVKFQILPAIPQNCITSPSFSNNTTQ